MEGSPVLSPSYQQQSTQVFSHDSVSGDGHYIQSEKPFLFTYFYLYLKLYGSVLENGKLMRST